MSVEQILKKFFPKIQASSLNFHRIPKIAYCTSLINYPNFRLLNAATVLKEEGVGVLLN